MNTHPHLKRVNKPLGMTYLVFKTVFLFIGKCPDKGNKTWRRYKSELRGFGFFLKPLLKGIEMAKGI